MGEECVRLVLVKITLQAVFIAIILVVTLRVLFEFLKLFAVLVYLSVVLKEGIYEIRTSFSSPGQGE